jgi:spermidine synthase
VSDIGKELYRSYDEYGLIKVVDDGNKRFLAFAEDDEQSCQLKSEPVQLQHDYTQAMLLVLLFCQPQKIILFGLGGGCLASTLHHHFPGLKLRVVELRQAVVDLAHRFFQLPRSKRMTVYTEDVGDFLQREHGKADVIFSDIYCAQGLDRQQVQPWFIERCAELLKDQGWLVLNCWRQHRAEDAMIESLQQHFTDVRVCGTAEGNWVVLAGKQRFSGSASGQKSAAKALSKKLGYSLSAHFSRLNQV